MLQFWKHGRVQQTILTKITLINPNKYSYPNISLPAVGTNGTVDVVKAVEVERGEFAKKYAYTKTVHMHIATAW